MEALRATVDCWEEDGSICKFAYDLSDGNESVATFADWIVARPLEVLFVLALALIGSRLARRWVKRFVARVVAPEKTSTDRLNQIGIELPSAMTPPPADPRRLNRADSISVVLTSTIVVTIWVIALLTVLSIMGIDLGPLLAGAGIAGVALGFGAQSLVKDCIAGLFMLIEDQYGIGDVVDLGEATGVVEEVTLRTTVLRSVDGTVWHVPNGVVERVGNKSQLWSVAVVDVDVAYDTDLERARDLILRAANEVVSREPFDQQVLDEPTVLGVEALAADGITVRLTIKVAPGTQWDLQRAVRQNIKATFDSEGVEIPFPQRTVWMRVPNDGPTDGPEAGSS